MAALPGGNDVREVLGMRREQPHGGDWGKKGGLGTGGLALRGRACRGCCACFRGGGVVEIPPCLRGVRLPGGRGAGEEGAWEAPGNTRCPARPGVAGGGVFWRG